MLNIADMAKAIRRERNLLTEKERAKLLKSALVIVRKGFNDYLKKIRTGDLKTVIVAVNNLRNEGWWFSNCVSYVSVSHAKKQVRHKLKTEKQLLNWIAKETQTISNERENDIKQVIEKNVARKTRKIG
jgi:hypothetical protein